MKKGSSNPARAAAELVRKQIIECIDNHQHFLVEAGAGAGKTYSLIETLQYITDRSGRQLLHRNQRVACITFTNVATDEILSRTDRHPAIQCETIHAFCWSLIKPFQSALRKHIPTLSGWAERLEAAGGLGDQKIEYNLGYPKVEERQLLMHHYDILALTVKMLAEKKFRRLFAEKFPILLVDEYQDTDGSFARAIIEHLIGSEKSPLIGFFGDHWQRIYGTGCGLIEHEKLTTIGKPSNFRSVTAIVSVLNRLRPELTQEVSKPKAVGNAKVFHTNAWTGERQTGPHTKGDLPSTVSHSYLEDLRNLLQREGWDFAPSVTKILMLTQKVLAAEQGYQQLASVFDRNDSFIKKEDAHVAFFIEMIEPLCTAYAATRFGEMFTVLGKNRPAIDSQDDKRKWKLEMDQLMQLRATGTIGDVVGHLRGSKIQIPNAVLRRTAAASDPNEAGEGNAAERLANLLAVPYKEVVALAQFIDGHTPFETKHGVKGIEFENVLVVVGRGWNQYNFNRLLELIGGAIPSKEAEFYERNRNLFYVACSRPKRRLAILFTQQLSEAALTTLERLFGKKAINALPSTPSTAY